MTDKQPQQNNDLSLLFLDCQKEFPWFNKTEKNNVGLDFFNVWKIFVWSYLSSAKIYIYIYKYNIYLSKNIFSQCQKNDTSIYFTYASKATFKFLCKLLNAMYYLSWKEKF